MKKIICIVLLVILSVMAISCGTKSKKSKVIDVTNANEDDKSEKTLSEQKKEESAVSENKAITENKIETTPQVNSKKQEYLAKLDGIEARLKELDALKAGSNLDMIKAADEEYRRWDLALNEIYGVLKVQLSTSEMRQLEKEEVQWIKNKEALAEAEGKKYEGGSMEPLAKSSSLADSTKKRCYELVNNYMK